MNAFFFRLKILKLWLQNIFSLTILIGIAISVIWLFLYVLSVDYLPVSNFGNLLTILEALIFGLVPLFSILSLPILLLYFLSREEFPPMSKWEKIFFWISTVIVVVLFFLKMEFSFIGKFLSLECFLILELFFMLLQFIFLFRGIGAFLVSLFSALFMIYGVFYTLIILALFVMSSKLYPLAAIALYIVLSLMTYLVRTSSTKSRQSKSLMIYLVGTSSKKSYQSEPAGFKVTLLSLAYFSILVIFIIFGGKEFISLPLQTIGLGHRYGDIYLNDGKVLWQKLIIWNLSDIFVEDDYEYVAVPFNEQKAKGVGFYRIIRKKINVVTRIPSSSIRRLVLYPLNFKPNYPHPIVYPLPAFPLPPQQKANSQSSESQKTSKGGRRSQIQAERGQKGLQGKRETRDQRSLSSHRRKTSESAGSGEKRRQSKTYTRRQPDTAGQQE